MALARYDAVGLSVYGSGDISLLFRLQGSDDTLRIKLSPQMRLDDESTWNLVALRKQCRSSSPKYTTTHVNTDLLAQHILSTCPDQFEDIETLHTLSVSFIMFPPNMLIKLPHLREITANHCGLTSLPESIMTVGKVEID